MTTKTLSVIFTGIFLFVFTGIRASKSIKDIEIEEKVSKLLSKMTLEEKTGQMTALALTTVCKGPFWSSADSLEIDTVKLNTYINKYHIGLFIDKGKYPPTVKEWGRLVRQIQEYAVKKSRLGIPVMYGVDGTHGTGYSANSTLFPHFIAIAATWDPYFAEVTAQVTAYEMRAGSLSLNFSPVLDVCRQPLWGRMFETFGEDTYITTQMGNAFVKGSQGANLSDSSKVAVCLKHYIGYGTPYNGKERASALIPDNFLRQYYLPPFIEAIQNGALSVMLNSGTVNGVAGDFNSYYINDVLKDELGFKGFVITDWDDAGKLIDMHKVANDKREAIKLMTLAGADLIMDPYDSTTTLILIDLVKKGEIPMSRIDDAVRRILRVKMNLGLFEKPYNNSLDFPKYGSSEFAEKSFQAALECMTLLKNANGILPLKKDVKVLITGPAANTINSLNGAWSRTWQGTDPTYNNPAKKTILQAIEDKVGKENVQFTEGCFYDNDSISQNAIDLASSVDYVIVCAGEKAATEMFSDILDLALPRSQIELVKQLKTTGKKIILVLVEGRPRLINEIEPLCDAIIDAYLPGEEGGRALAEVIFGDFNPSGKLPFTYPRTSASLIQYNHKKGDNFFDYNRIIPQYEFGYGMSYTTFEYSDPKLSTEFITGDKELTVSIDITNTGTIAGKEVVEVYIEDIVASLTPDVKKLVRFKKISLNPSETKTVEFILTKRDLGFVGIDNKWITESGKFIVSVGGGLNSLKSKEFSWIK